MQKYVVRFATAALLGIAVIVRAVGAADVTMLTGAAGYNHPLILPVVTQRAGPLVAEAQWTPKNNTRYVLTVRHLLMPNDPNSYDVFCQVYEPLTGAGSGQTVGHYHCDFPSAPAGYWSTEFRPITGKATATLTVTGETD